MPRRGVPFSRVVTCRSLNPQPSTLNLLAQFTPATERALVRAACWSSRADSDELHLPEVLLGLLGEDECRAAAMLASHGIDLVAVRRRWPELRQVSADDQRERRFSDPLRQAVREAEARLWAYPRPLVLATEQLLLGIVGANQEVADWLIAQGFDPDRLEAEIHQMYGHDPSPIPAEDLLSNPVVPTAPVQAGLGSCDSVGPLRAFDAAANRAREGLRVVEDFVRFVFDDGYLTEQLKRLRHDLTATLAAVPAASLYAARETQADVGAVLSTAGETLRADNSSVLAANFKRLQEALRSLEEFAKLLSPGADGPLKQLRYRTYTLERAVEITRVSLSRLAAARLYVLIDGGAALDAFSMLAESLIGAGVHILQLREKRLDDRALVERGRRLRELTRGTETLFVMNNRPDLAALTQADGVHIGQEELSVKDARAIVGPAALVGVSTHSLDQARQAVLDGANYLGVGPTFPSRTKSFERFVGVELLQAVAREIRLPAFAIGGIDRENLPLVLSSGFSRVAVAGAITTADDPPQAARQILALLQGPGIRDEGPETRSRGPGKE